MPPHIAQEGDVFELVEPLGIVELDGVGRAIAEGKEGFEGAADAGLVVRDGLVAQQRPDLVAEGRVADARGAAAHQHDGLVAAALQQAQQHDRQQVADMQAVRRQVEARIGGKRPRLQARDEGFLVGDLVDEAALARRMQEIVHLAGFRSEVCLSVGRALAQ